MIEDEGVVVDAGRVRHRTSLKSALVALLVVVAALWYLVSLFIGGPTPWVAGRPGGGRSDVSYAELPVSDAWRDLHEAHHDAVMTIGTMNRWSGEFTWGGRGVFVSADGLMLVTQHQIESLAERVTEATPLHIMTADGVFNSASVLYCNPNVDLALLRTDYRPSSYLSVVAAADEPAVGDATYTLHFPTLEIVGDPHLPEDVDDITELAGEVESVSEMKIVTSAASWGGVSGSPVVNGAGELIGLVSRGSGTGSWLSGAGAMRRIIERYRLAPPVRLVRAQDDGEVWLGLFGFSAEPAVDDVGLFGATPLGGAISVGCAELIDELVERGFDLNAQGLDGSTPLIAAVKSYQDSTATVEMILDAGADTNLIDGDGYRVLYYALGIGDEDLLELLLARGADPDLLDEKGFSALHCMVYYGEARLFDILVKGGADVKLLGPMGETILHMAVHHESSAMLGAALRAVPELVNNADDYGRTPMHAVAHSGSPVMLRMLLREGGEVEAIDFSERSVLHAATYNENYRVLEGLLAEAGELDVDVVDTDGFTALMYAATESSARHVRILLAAGADPLVVADDGESRALDYALMRDDDDAERYEVVEVLEAAMGEVGGHGLDERVDGH